VKRANGMGSISMIGTGPNQGRWKASIQIQGRRRDFYGHTREEAEVRMEAYKAGVVLQRGDTLSQLMEYVASLSERVEQLEARLDAIGAAARG
jgi:hypothetical protein